jgi:anti-sigma B factor antagonist
MAVTINTVEGKENTVISVKGRVDSLVSPELQAAVIGVLDISASVTLDFTELSYISSAGLRVLLMAHKDAAGLKKGLCLRGLSDEIKQILEMTGFLEFLNME